MKLLNQCTGWEKQRNTGLHSFDMVTLPLSFLYKGKENYSGVDSFHHFHKSA